MKKAAVFLLLFLSFSAAKGQDSVVYRPVFINSCNNNLDIITQLQSYNEATLVDDSGNLCVVRFDPETITSFKVPKAGKYTLKRSSENGPISRYIDITFENDTITDTIKTYYMGFKRHFSDYGVDFRLQYYDCNGYLNESHKHFHPNGQLMFDCNFKNGFPIDTLKVYYEDGKLNKIMYSDSSFGFYQSYDTNGGLLDYSYIMGHKKKWGEKHHTKSPFKYICRTYITDIYNKDLLNFNFVDSIFSSDTVFQNHEFNPLSERFYYYPNGQLFSYHVTDSVYEILLLYQGTNISFSIDSLHSERYIHGDLFSYYSNKHTDDSNYKTPYIIKSQTLSAQASTKNNITKTITLTKDGEKITTHYILINGEWIEQKEE